jgi:CheY-like chemotaxis protein/two-component sensor histidine kinase
LLLCTELGERQRGFVQTVRASSEQLLALLNDILDFSKIEAGGLQLERTPVRMEEVAHRAAALVASTIGSKPVELTVHVDRSVPALFVGDPTRWSQVIVNLTNNAVKFTERGEVAVRLTLDDGDELVLTVRDTGIGIAPERVGSVFAEFEQEDATTTRRFGGTGLGLSITQRIVAAMGGRIEVASELGEGTTFTVRVPVQPLTDASKVATDRLKGLHLLVVDDHPTNRELLAYLLDGWGIRGTYAASADEALAALDDGDALDGALVDYQMPGTDGLALTEQLRERWPALPVMLLTSHGSMPEAEAMQALAGVMAKPIRPSQLYDALASLFLRITHRPAPERREAPSVDLRHLKVLVAEDNLVNQQVAKLSLEALGIDADMVSDGVEAVEAVQRVDYDLVLMDLQMPRLDGLEATRRILAEAQSPPRIVAMTANASAEDRRACRDVGMKGYLTKPFVLERLRDEIEATAVASSRRTRPDEPAPGPAALPGDVVDTSAFEALRALYGRSTTHRFADALQLATTTFAGCVAEAQAAVDADDAAALAAAMHKLKSSAAQFGALRVHARVVEIEQRARRGSTEGADLEELRRRIARYEELTEPWRRGEE